MRSLILFFFVSIHSWAASYEVRSSLAMEDSKAPLSIFGIQNSWNTQSLRSSLAFRSEDILDGLQNSLQVDVNRPDYKNLNIRDQRQQPIIVENPGTETFLDAGIAYARKNIYLGYHFFSHLSKSPFSQRGMSLQAEYDFYEKTSLVGVESTFLTQKRPQDFFVDRDFRIKARPTKIHAQEYALYMEQVMNEYWKSRLRLLTNQKKEERPRVIGVEATQAVALFDTVYTSLYTNFYNELRGESLKNERGYFRAYQAKLEITREWFYNFTTSISYGVTVEKELDPRLPSEVQIGSDHYGIGMEYGYKNISFEALGSWYQTNSGSSGTQWSGAIAWSI